MRDCLLHISLAHVFSLRKYFYGAFDSGYACGLSFCAADPFNIFLSVCVSQILVRLVSLVVLLKGVSEISRQEDPFRSRGLVAAARIEERRFTDVLDQRRLVDFVHAGKPHRPGVSIGGSILEESSLVLEQGSPKEHE